MSEALQATMANALLIISILNLASRRGALLSLQFHRNVINMDIKIKLKETEFDLNYIVYFRVKIKMYL